MTNTDPSILDRAARTVNPSDAGAAAYGIGLAATNDTTNLAKMPAAKVLDGDESVVAYTPELWAGLSQIFDNLDKTASTIQSMLGTKKGLALITELGAGAKQLAAGSMTPS